MKDRLEFKITTAIPQRVIKKSLMRASLFGGLGVAALILTAVFLPREKMETFGIWIIFAWLIVEYLAFRHYQILKRRETHPDEILGFDDHIVYRGTKISFSEIESMEYHASNYLFGIKVRLKNGKTLFMPYFSKSSLRELESFL